MSTEWPLFRQNGWKPSSFPFLWMYLIFSIIMFFFEFYLEIRQLARTKEEEPPKKLFDLLHEIEKEDDQKDKNEETLTARITQNFRKAQHYSKDKLVFGLISSLFFQVLEISFLLIGQLPFTWDLSVVLLDRAGIDESRTIIISLVFFWLLFIQEFFLSLPIELYSTFVIEERHSFNKQTLGGFIKDKVKYIVLMIIIGGPVSAGLLKLIEWGGKNFHFYVWGFMLLISILLMTIYPVLIAPLFNKFTPLEEGELKTKIEKLVASVGFPLKKLYVIDGSKRSSHSNAYMYGFFNNKRIVLFDTLLKQVNNEEIIAVLSHELGHWAKWHTVLGFIITQVHLFVLFFLFGFVINEEQLYTSFGFSRPQIAVGLLLFMNNMWSPIEKFLVFLMNIFSRHNEFQADSYATSLGYGQQLQLALVKLHIENLGTLNPDPLYSAFHYSHPPLIERLSAISDEVKKRS